MCCAAARPTRGCVLRARSKVPRDLTEATLSGGTLSLISSIVMAYLFFTNFASFLTLTTTTTVQLDESQEQKLQINFNVTLHHLPCRFASVDIVDVMGTHLQNVSKNVAKTRITSDGASIGRHKTPPAEPKFAEPRAPAHEIAEVHPSHGALPAVARSQPRASRPQVSPELSAAAFSEAIRRHQLVLVNYYAPWCPWSRRLAPVWEEAAKNVAKVCA